MLDKICLKRHSVIPDQNVSTSDNQIHSILFGYTYLGQLTYCVSIFGGVLSGSQVENWLVQIGIQVVFYPTSAHACGEVTGCALAAKRLASVAPEVNLGECTLHSPPQK